MTSYGEVERELAALLRRARAWNRDVATVVHPDLQPTAYALLARVDELGSVRAIDLSDYFGIDKGAISRQVGAAGAGRAGRPRAGPGRRPGPAAGRDDEGRKRLAIARSGRRQVVREQLDRWPDAGRRDLRRAARPVQPADGRGRRRRRRPLSSPAPDREGITGAAGLAPKMTATETSRLPSACAPSAGRS